MKFYFCETCGKRVTDEDVTAGAARDKKLKGVYCKECAVGVMTMETLPITEAQAQKILSAEDSKTARPRSGSSEYKNVPVRRTTDSVAQIKASALGSAATGSSAPRTTTLIAVVIGSSIACTLILALMIRGASEPPAPALEAGGSAAPLKSALPHPVPESVPPSIGGAPAALPKVEASAPAPAAPAVTGELQAALALQAAQPNDHAALISAFERAVDQTRGTAAAGAAVEALKSARTRWETALQEALKTARGAADAARGRMDFAAAMAALGDEAVPPALRSGDWPARLETERAVLRQAAEAAAAEWLEEARTLAQVGDPVSIRAAIQRAQKAEAIPAEWAPSAAKAAQAGQEWAARLETAQQDEEREKRKESGKARLAALRVELDPLLKRNRLAEAMALVEGSLRGRSVDDAYLQQEKADIQALVELRQAALAILQGMTGKTVSLRMGKTAVTARVKDGGAKGTLVLKLADGPELSIGVEQLEAQDVDTYAPKGEGADDLRQRGLLFLAAGDVPRAKPYFIQARDGGLGNAVQPYLERIEIVELGEAEVRARKAWTQAEALFSDKMWKDAAAAYEAYRTAAAQLPSFAKNADMLKARLAEIDKAVNPLQPGVVAMFYKGREFKDSDHFLTKEFQTMHYFAKEGWPTRTWTVPSITEANYAVRLVGRLKIEKDDSYAVLISLAEGQCWVDGKLVANRMGAQKGGATTLKLDLKAGFHDIRLETYMRDGTCACGIHWGDHPAEYSKYLITKEYWWHDARDVKAPPGTK